MGGDDWGRRGSVSTGDFRVEKCLSMSTAVSGWKGISRQGGAGDQGGDGGECGEGGEGGRGSSQATWV